MGMDVAPEVAQAEAVKIAEKVMRRDDTTRKEQRLNAVLKEYAHNLTRGGRTRPYRRPWPKIGRNDKCPCGSDLKFKKCCLNTVGRV